MIHYMPEKVHITKYLQTENIHYTLNTVLPRATESTDPKLGQFSFEQPVFLPK